MNDFNQNGPFGEAPCGPDNANLNRVERRAPIVGPVSPGKGKLILLVDDDDAWVWIGQRILSSLAYKVIGYTNPAEALSCFRTQPQLFDLVITDLNMPVLDGVTLAAKLLKLRPDLPMILMTSGDGMITPEDIRQTGFRMLLLKPELARTLGNAVQEALESPQESPCSRANY